MTPRLVPRGVAAAAAPHMPNPRKPTHLKVVAGTDRADRRHAHEPRPKPARLLPPACLSRRAKLVWAKASKLLHEMGVLTTADGPALEALCEALADAHEARAALAKAITAWLPIEEQELQERLLEQPHGGALKRRWRQEGDRILIETEIAAAGSLTYVTIGKSGPLIRMRPEVAAIADADRRVSMWLAKFGLTPADRSRVGGAPPETSNPFDAF